MNIVRGENTVVVVMSDLEFNFARHDLEKAAEKATATLKMRSCEHHSVKLGEEPWVQLGSGGHNNDDWYKCRLCGRVTSD